MTIQARINGVLVEGSRYGGDCIRVESFPEDRVSIWRDFRGIDRQGVQTGPNEGIRFGEVYTPDEPLPEPVAGVEVRDLNANGYYTWEDSDGKLTIYSECCADSFSPEEEIVLRDYLLKKHPLEEGGGR